MDLLKTKNSNSKSQWWYTRFFKGRTGYPRQDLLDLLISKDAYNEEAITDYIIRSSDHAILRSSIGVLKTDGAKMRVLESSNILAMEFVIDHLSDTKILSLLLLHSREGIRRLAQKRLEVLSGKEVIENGCLAD